MAGRLTILTGAPGSGKSTILPGLRDALPGIVVLDLDEFHDAGSRLAGADLSVAEDRWAAYEDLCLTLVAAVLRAGHDVLLSSPLEPHQVERSSADLGTVRWGVLDCSDGTRSARLKPRGYPAEVVVEALADAADLRALGADVLVNDGLAVVDAVDLVVRWFRAG